MRSDFEKKYLPDADLNEAFIFSQEEDAYSLKDEFADAQDANKMLIYLNASYDAWKSRQTEVDELQRRNQMLNDNVKEQGQKLVYQNEVIETQAEKLLGLRDESAELQKRVDRIAYLLPGLKAENDLWGCDQVEVQIELLEQALKGESNE